jgi:WD40 repeat protein/serine/threonine protein kinase
MIDQPRWRVGDTIADLYEVRGINTEGGMSIVYFVWHTQWQMELVIKSPRPELIADEVSRNRFVTEAETWVKLGLHPNIVTAYYVRQIENFPRIVIEKMNGGSLQHWLREGKVRDLATALDIAIQIASGIAYAGSQHPGFVHRDIKPANVLMTPSGEAKVTDFGLVGAAGACVGTPAYMAPEMWIDLERVTPAADQYAFGVLLYELLTGRRPFERRDSGTSLGEIAAGREVEGSIGALRQQAVARVGDVSIGEQSAIERVTDASLGDAGSRSMWLAEHDLAFYRSAHASQTPDPPSTFSPRLPVVMDDLCLALLSKDPAARPSAVDVIGRLRSAYGDSLGHAYPREESKPALLLAGSLNNRALSFIDLGKQDEALAAFGEALRVQASYADAEYNDGLLRWQQGGATDIELVDRLERCARSNSADWRAPYLLGLTHIVRRDALAAEAALKDAAGRNSAEPEIAQALDELQRERTTWTAPLRDPIEPESDRGFSINAIALSTDARTVVMAGDIGFYGLLRIWDVPSGESLHELIVYEGAPLSLALSDDARLAVTGGHDARMLQWHAAGKADYTATVFDPRRRWLERLRGPRTIEVRTRNHSVTVWNLSNGWLKWRRGPRRAALMKGHRAEVLAVAMTRDKTLALSASADKRIGMWELKRGKLRRWLDSHDGAVTSLALTPDERLVLSGSADHTLRLWDLQSGECMRVFRGHDRAISSVAVSRDGLSALSGGADRTVRQWDLRTGDCVRTLTMPAGSAHVRAVAYAGADAVALSCGHDDDLGYIRVWHLESGRCVRTITGHRKRVTQLARSADAAILASASEDHRVRFWRLGSFDVPRRRYVLSRVARSSTQFAEARRVASLVARIEACVQRERWHEAASLAREARSVPGYERKPELLSLWHALALKGKRTGLRGHWEKAALPYTHPICSLAISSDGGCVASGHESGQLLIWNVGAGGAPRTVRIEPESNEVTSVAFSPDNRVVVSGTTEGLVRCWDAASGDCIRTLSGHTHGIASVTVGRDGRILSTGMDGALREWDPGSGECITVVDLRAFREPRFTLRVAACLHGGRFAILRYDDKTFLSTPSTRHLLEIPHLRLPPLDRRVDVLRNVVAISKDEERLLMSIGLLELWDLKSERPMGLVGDVEGARAAYGDLKRFTLPAELKAFEAVEWVPGTPFALTIEAATMPREGFLVKEEELSIWNVSTRRHLGVLAQFTRHDTDATLLRVSANGRFVAAAGADDILRVWELDWDFEATHETHPA